MFLICILNVSSVLAILMTVVPYKLPPGFGSASGSQSSGSHQESAKPAFFYASMQPAQTPSNTVSIVLVSEDGRAVSGAVLTLLARETHGIVAQARTQAGAFSFIQPAGRYLIRVEATGYAILEDSLNLRPGDSPTIRLCLRPTWVPLPIQRLFKS